MKGDDNKVKGAGDGLKGKVEKATGEVTGNQHLKNEGDKDKAKGAVKSGVGRVQNAAEELTD